MEGPALNPVQKKRYRGGRGKGEKALQDPVKREKTLFPPTDRASQKIYSKLFTLRLAKNARKRLELKDLSSFHRACVYDYCKRLDLIPTSVGEDGAKYLEVELKAELVGTPVDTALALNAQQDALLTRLREQPAKLAMRQAAAGRPPEGQAAQTKSELLRHLPKYAKGTTDEEHRSNASKAMELFEDDWKEGKAMNAHIYNLLLHILSLADHTEQFVQVYEQLDEAGLRPNEGTLACAVKTFSAMGQPERALQAIQDFVATGQKVHVRCYTPLLKGFCDTLQVPEALGVLDQLQAQGLSISEEEYAHLIRACGRASMGEKAAELLQAMADTVPACTESSLEVLHEWFASPAAQPKGHMRWQVSWPTTISIDGLCAANGQHLSSIVLTPAEQEQFRKEVETACFRNHKEAFEGFKGWLDQELKQRGPYDVLIDGANVGMFGQSGAHGQFSITQLYNMVRFFQNEGKRILVFLHRRHLKHAQQNQPRNPAIRHACELLQSVTYFPKDGTNDDWYWLYAAIACGDGAFVVSNDHMRDHVFQLQDPKHFLTWKERHQIKFMFNRDLMLELSYPPSYSRRLQLSPCGSAWYFPSAENEDLWMCAWQSNMNAEAPVFVPHQN